jgi:hypothetical protein
MGCSKNMKQGGNNSHTVEAVASLGLQYAQYQFWDKVSEQMPRENMF